MGAELSRPAGPDITNLRDEDARRRVGSSSSLDTRRPLKTQQTNGLPTSASTTALSSMTQTPTPNQTQSLRSSSANAKSKLLESGLFSSMRRSRNSRNAVDSASVLSGGDHVESLDLPIVEWEGYVTKRGHLVRNWKSRFFTLEGNLVSCTLLQRCWRRGSFALTLLQ
jgi:hypothetical protein